jgi:hypothetical protein
VIRLARRAWLVVALLLLIGPASGECAWVLWTKVNTQEWETRGEYPTRSECERERGKSVEGVLQGTGGSQFVVVNACLPDTEDPRDPSAKSRPASAGGDR